MFEQRSDVLKVQRGPFVDSGRGRIAYVREGDELVRRSISTQPGSLSEVEIVSGLDEGEEIVIGDLARFEDAKRIALH
jgi:HlyD family secretion protein